MSVRYTARHIDSFYMQTCWYHILFAHQSTLQADGGRRADVDRPNRYRYMLRTRDMIHFALDECAADGMRPESLAARQRRSFCGRLL